MSNTKLVRLAAVLVCVSILACHGVAGQKSPEHARSSPVVPDARAAAGGNPILPGDHPDPSIMRVGKTYWTTSTSGDWVPEFVLYRSEDLHHWTAAGAVFPRTPAWAVGDFWAPELVNTGKQIVVYYVARDHKGILCVAAATASSPQGPYTDHGPIQCQPDGSIDPAFARDEHGAPYLVWKEDGNSQGKLTPIWAQPLTPDLVHLTGAPRKLIENDSETWEGGVVEAPFVLRHGGRFYLFYAGNACCGTECHYAEGVARADHLLGPWVKDPENPIIRPNAEWKCPGHGSAVETPAGRDFFVYHAYPAAGTVYVGRESVLDPITWAPNGWPEINRGHGPGNSAANLAATPEFHDHFNQGAVDPEWKWPIGHMPEMQEAHGHLLLHAPTTGLPVFLGRSLFTPAYRATVQVSATSGAQGGLGVIGGRAAQVILSVEGNRLELWKAAHGQRQVLWTGALPTPGNVWLQAQSTGNGNAQFAYSLDGQQWTPAGPARNTRDLIPWDQGIRIGLVAGGQPGATTSFADFTLKSQ